MPGRHRWRMFSPSRSSSMVQVEMGLLSLCEDSSVSFSPSSQMWRVSLVSPSSPTLLMRPLASIWPSLRRKSGRPSRSWPCQPPGKCSLTTGGSWGPSHLGYTARYAIEKKISRHRRTTKDGLFIKTGAGMCSSPPRSCTGKSVQSGKCTVHHQGFPSPREEAKLSKEFPPAGLNGLAATAIMYDLRHQAPAHTNSVTNQLF